MNFLKMISLVLFVLGAIVLSATEGCGAGKQLMSKFQFNYIETIEL